jgi:3-oxoacyl-[acyl-carrier protein] reductase
VLVAELAPPMASRGSGVIITIGSWMASVGSPFAALYTATKAADEQLTAGTPAGRPVSPDDIAVAVAFLASGEARMIHGSTLYVDGGITATRLG